MAGFDPDKDKFDWMVPAGTAVAGAVGGRMLGRGVAKKIVGADTKGKGKGKKSKSSGGSVSIKELRARQAGLGTGAAGAAGGYEMGRVINNPESVREDIENAIAIREGIGDTVRDAGMLGQYASPVADVALKAATLGLAGKFAHGMYKEGKALSKGFKSKKEVKSNHMRKAIPYGLGAIGTGTADLMVMPKEGKR